MKMPTMMIVDDVDMDRDIIKNIFKNEFVFLEAANAEEAISILKKKINKIDFLILDISMPGMSGIEMLKIHGEKPYLKGVPVAIVTSNDDSESLVEAFDAGASEFILKPIDAKVVHARIISIWAASYKLRKSEHEKLLLKKEIEKDSMTGLLNKNTAQNIIEDYLENDPDGIHALLMIDIDNFKSVNDQLGHLSGDKVISLVAKIMRERFRKNDIIARYGGDEFCIFMHDLPNRQAAKLKAQSLLGAIQIASDRLASIPFSISIGLAFSDRIKSDFTQLIKNADDALYKAKMSGKSCICEYDDHTLDTIVIKEVKEDIVLVRTLLNRLPVGVGLLYIYPNNKMSFGYFNDSFYKMLGETREDRQKYIGDTLFESIHKDDAPKAIDSAMKSAREHINGNVDVRICHKNGSYKWYNAQSAVADTTVDYTLLYVTLVDINHLK